VNNYLAGAGENVMFGGADARIANLSPSDIEIRRNHFHKPTSWNWNHPDFKPLGGESVRWAGKQFEKASGGPPQHWTVKNVLELKHAKRVVIDGNLFENHWADAQSGHAILFTVRNQDGGNPWAQVADITATNNVLRNSSGGINILGTDDLNPSQRTARILIRNWSFENVNWEHGNGVNSLFQLLGGDDITIEHVSCASLKGNLALVDNVVRRLRFANNIVPTGAYGIHLDNSGSVEARLPDRTFEGNVIIGGDARSWAFGGKNSFPPTARAVGFADEERGDLRLDDSSRFKGAGADLAAIRAAMGPEAAPAATRPRRVVSR
jgi:hypothetical protein